MTSEAEEFALNIIAAMEAGRRGRAALKTILAARISILRQRYDPTLPLTPERLFYFRAARRILKEVV